MPTYRRRTACAALAILALGASTVGCSSKKSSGPNFASTLPSTSSAQLTKTEFVSKMNAICSAIDSQRKALPTPSGLTDYPNIVANLSGTLRLLPSFIQQADQLVNRSADKAELTEKWLAIEKSDFATVKPLAERMVADSNAKDSAKVAADGEALSSAPDHSSTIATFM
ncbi:MAG: hypothetical protein ABI418_18745, partial [Jatrophihabitantaceae bacterium]